MKDVQQYFTAAYCSFSPAADVKATTPEGFQPMVSSSNKNTTTRRFRLQQAIPGNPRPADSRPPELFFFRPLELRTHRVKFYNLQMKISVRPVRGTRCVRTASLFYILLG